MLVGVSANSPMVLSLSLLWPKETNFSRWEWAFNPSQTSYFTVTPMEDLIHNPYYLYLISDYLSMEKYKKNEVSLSSFNYLFAEMINYLSKKDELNV